MVLAQPGEQAAPAPLPGQHAVRGGERFGEFLETLERKELAADRQVGGMDGQKNRRRGHQGSDNDMTGMDRAGPGGSEAPPSSPRRGRRGPLVVRRGSAPAQRPAGSTRNTRPVFGKTFIVFSVGLKTPKSRM